MRCGAFTRYCRNIGFQSNEVFSAIFYLKTDFSVDYLTNQAREYRSFALGFSKIASSDGLARKRAFSSLCGRFLCARGRTKTFHTMTCEKHWSFALKRTSL